MDKTQLLLREIEIVQSEIARFDANGLTIKEWCIGIWSGLIAFGFAEGEAPVMLAAVATTIAFAFVELTYRRFQCRFIDRSASLEQILQTGNLKAYSYGVNRAALGNRRFVTESLRVLKMGQFTLLYSALLILAAISICYVRGV